MIESSYALQHRPSAKVIGVDDLVEVQEGVYYSSSTVPFVDSGVIDFLKHVASTCQLRRARVCAHESPGSEQHDMLIVCQRDTYVTPHRHMSKSETFVVLEGLADILLFDEDGRVEKVVKMGPPSSNKPFFYRMPPRKFHSLAIETELLVFIESTKGPFSRDDRENASWAPGFGDLENGKAYIASLLRKA